MTGLETMKNRNAITLFGGTGDLTYRKLLPALYNLDVLGQLDDEFKIIVIGRRPYTPDQYIEIARDWVKEHARTKFDEEQFSSYSRRIIYFKMDMTDEEEYRILQMFYDFMRIDQHVYYYAVAPSFFLTITRGLKKYCSENNAKVIVEKPFGENLEKAEIELVEIKDIPLFNKPADKKVPEAITEIAAKIEAADGVIISSPEYDHAVPASLMSVIAWLSYGIHPLLDKPVMLTGASYGTLGSSRAQAHIRQILDSPEVKARVMPSSEFLLGRSLQAFDEAGDISNPETVAKLDSLFADFLLFIKITEKLMHAHKQAEKEIENFSWEDLK